MSGTGPNERARMAGLDTIAAQLERSIVELARLLAGGDTTGDPACISPWWHPDAGDLAFLYRDQQGGLS